MSFGFVSTLHSENQNKLCIFLLRSSRITKNEMNLHIPSPCPESWDNMLPAEKGKHCLACDKVVVDFTQMNAEQIKAFFQIPREKKVCGRFLSSQLEQPEHRHIPLTTLQNRLSVLKPNARLLSMAIGFLSSLLALVGCGQETKMGEPAVVPSEVLPPAPSKGVDSIEKNHVKGKVKIGSDSTHNAAPKVLIPSEEGKRIKMGEVG